MKTHIAGLFIAGLVCPIISVDGQAVFDEKGFEAGIFRFQPVLEATAGYDNRVIDVPADGDTFAETKASLRVENTDARYDIGGWAAYGYRAYDKYSALSDDFYGVGGNIASRQNSLKSGLNAYFKKTLDYDIRVGEESGLGAILTSSTSERASVNFDVGYERQVTDKSAIMPMYEGSYYYQNFDGQEDAEWQEHRMSLEYGYGVNPRMLLTLSGGYEMQINEDETGSIIGVAVGAKSRATDKINWSAKLGVSSADYELSGTDEGFVGSLNVRWKTTDKISAYAFGRSGYQPGQGGGGAQKILRAGYGADWAVVEKIVMDLQFLHDYQDSIQGSGGSNADVRHFVTGRISYDINRYMAISLSVSYVNDELEEDQTVAAAKVVLSY